LTEQERLARHGSKPKKGWRPNAIVEATLRRQVTEAQKLLDEYLKRKAQYEAESIS
jgi:hypothetical protein